MSRCFPFPPPGYERKLRIDDPSLLAKEERKEKKSKKHKKDKDKDRKESKEKERNKDKRRDKKKKDKHREKDGEKKQDNGEQPERSYVENRLPADQIEDTAFVQEHSRRIRDEGGATCNKATGKPSGSDKKGADFLEEVAETKVSNRSAEREIFKDKTEYVKKANEKRVSDTKVPRVAVKTTSNGVHKPLAETEKKSQNGSAFNSMGKKDENEKRFGEQSQSSNGGKFYSNVQANQLKKCASMQELGKGVRGEDSVIQSEVIGRINAPIDRRAESQEVVFGNNADYWSDGTNASKNVKVNHGLPNGPKNNNEPKKGPKVSIVHKPKGTEQRRLGAIRPIDTCVQKPVVKVSSKGDVSDTFRDEKESKSKSEDRGRKKEREEKVEEADKSNYKMPQLRELNNSLPYPSKESIKITGERITNKRKEPGSNGFLQGNEVRPNKVPRSHPVTENGRKPDLGQNICESAAKEPFISSGNHRNKAHKMNGFVEDPQRITGSIKPLAAAPKAKQVDRTSLRTSVPDVKSSPIPSHGDVKAASSTLLHSDAKAVSPKTQIPYAKTASPKPSHPDLKAAPPRPPHPDVKAAPPKPPHPEVKTVPTRPEPDIKTGSPRPPQLDVKAASPKPTNPEVEASSSKRTRPDAKASPLKRPHPDAKYLNQILLVPKPEEWPDFDDRDWLFETSNSLPKKVKVDSCSEEDESQQHQEVWSKALYLESADISVLPYVIPY